MGRSKPYLEICASLIVLTATLAAPRNINLSQAWPAVAYLEEAKFLLRLDEEGCGNHLVRRVPRGFPASALQSVRCDAHTRPV